MPVDNAHLHRFTDFFSVSVNYHSECDRGITIHFKWSSCLVTSNLCVSCAYLCVIDILFKKKELQYCNVVIVFKS